MVAVPFLGVDRGVTRRLGLPLGLPLGLSFWRFRAGARLLQGLVIASKALQVLRFMEIDIYQLSYLNSTMAMRAYHPFLLRGLFLADVLIPL